MIKPAICKHRENDEFQSHPYIIKTPLNPDFNYLADYREFLPGCEGSTAGLCWWLGNEVFEYHGSGFLIRYNPSYKFKDDEVIEEKKIDEVDVA